MISSMKETFYRLDNLNAQHQRINYQLSTRDKLQYGSDDSSVYTRELHIEDKIRMYEGLKVQIERTTAQNRVSDSTLSEAKKLLNHVKTEVLKALNSTVDDEARKAIAINLKGIKENLFDFANTNTEGEYLFSGSNSSIRPFLKDETTGLVTYNGNREFRKAAVDDGSYRDRGVNGINAFFTTSATAETTNKLEFSLGDEIYDQDGNKLERHRLVETGGKFTFSSEPIIDGDNNSWTLNTSATPPELQEDGGNRKISLTDNGNGTYTVASVPDFTKGLRFNQLRQYDENDNLIAGKGIDIKGTYPNELSVTVPNTLNKLEVKTSVFNILDNIINSLNKVDVKGNKVSSKEARATLSKGSDDIHKIFDDMNSSHARLGGRNKVFEISYERVSARVFQYEKLQEEVSGVDLAKVASEAKALELTYNALYSTISRTNELSLVNFLR